MKTAFVAWIALGLVSLAVVPVTGQEAEMPPPAGAKRQTNCPILKGNAINSKFFVDFGGKRIYTCCGVCLATVKADPAKYVKQLEAQGISLDKTQAAAGANSLRIRHMPRINRSAYVRTPEYQSTSTHSVRKPREWAAFEVSYDTAPEWIDDLVFTYYLMSERRTADGKKEYSLFQTTVHYGDVARGEHLSMVVLAPAALARYGDPVALALEITDAGGNALASESVTNAKELPADWWKNPKVTESPSVVKREGCLMDRIKSPFAFINADDYEAVK